MEKQAILIRQHVLSDNNQTCGNLILLGEKGIEFECVTLELPWKDNQRSVSCIPEGNYQVELYNSPSQGPGTFHVKDVPARSYILIHPGNYTKDSEGCILLGSKFSDIDKDGITDVVNSRVTVDRLKALVGPFRLKVMWI